ncbi:ankyrin repeat domain-containing protein 13B-like [Dendronephthya gigantea]|uniref:ankyrin repeat domain-containing protein 13B-like n=1 Tax=Dendronephthya gigantea TaxID=151771 RepID=UPI001069ECCF|nr:ankyrin repeat domain-containing protein 13B-like [Dendronephthya gigantea]
MAEKQWQVVNKHDIMKKWPLHCLVFEDKPAQLKDILKENKVDVERLDPCGRTALHVAVTLGRTECVKILLDHGVDANAVNKQGWNVCQEAVSSGDPEILSLVFTQRDFQRATQRLDGIPELLEDLNAAPDFYIEMKWEFTTWVPFMSKMCPNDTYKIYKQGCNVRVDTTLIGFDQNIVNWERGNMSFIFKGAAEGAEFFEINHDRKLFTKEKLQMREENRETSVFETAQDAINTRMSSPNISTILDTDSIAFTKHKTMWGWGGDKTETIEDHEGKMYDATGIDVVTRIRFEHLTEEEKKSEKSRVSSSGSGLQSVLSGEQQETICDLEDPDIVDQYSLNPYGLSVEEYFNLRLNKSKKDIGRPKDMISKTQKFKATLCLCPTYPLSLQQQVLPVIKLLAISNSHFAKLRDFVALHLPSGFPLKIEIPVFHFLNARITFGNINAIAAPVPGVTSHVTSEPSPEEDLADDETRVTCAIDADRFLPPTDYVDRSRVEQYSGQHIQNDEELLIQLAIQQSLADSGGTGDARQNSWGQRTHLSNSEEDLQRAIRESLAASDQGTSDSTPAKRMDENPGSYDEQLQIALAMSVQDVISKSQEQRNEDDELKRILKLSLTEK